MAMGGFAAAAPSFETLLSLETLVPYLLANQLVSGHDVVNTAFEARDYTRRNRNFKVIAPEGQSLLVKQAWNPRDSDYRDSIEKEAALLYSVGTEPEFADARWFAPRLLFHDPRNVVLVTELIHPATSITKYHHNFGQVTFPVDSARTCARILADFHRAGSTAVEGGALPYVPERRPFVWDAFRRLDRLQADAGAAVRDLWAVVQASDFWSRIPELHSEWQRHDSLIHLDVRWDNFLLTHGEGPDGNLNVRLIDWELASRGDPAWDVACYLGDHLRLWLMMLKVKPNERVENPEARQTFPISAGHYAARTFWREYANRAAHRGDEREVFLRRVMDYIPFYLVLIAIEMLQNAQSMHPPSRAAFDLACRVSESPDATARRLFGLTPGGGA